MNTDLPRAILLDLDDTIIDDSANVDGAWTQVCGEAADCLSALDALVLRHEIEVVREWYYSDAERFRAGRADLNAASTWIINEALSNLGFEASELAGVLSNRYRDLRLVTSLMPDAIETLEKLRELGISLALLTNGSTAGQRAKIERFDLARHFDFVCIEGEFGCGKPDERVYRAALDALNARPEQTWMAGDNFEWDVAAPMKLGITGIWLDYYSSGLPQSATTQPHRIIRSISELL